MPRRGVNQTVVPQQSQAVAQWDEQLAAYAEEARAMESSTQSSQFISVRGGQLVFNDAMIPGNEVAVIILDYVLENVYYPGPFDPDTPQSPVCFAFGRNEKELVPHAEATDIQNDTCVGCPQNAWGTADRGRGKACRNTRRLAMIPIGNFDKDGNVELMYDGDEQLPEHVTKAQIALLKLPVTSVKGYSAYVKQVDGSLRRPPCGVYTRMYIQPHPKDQFHVLFEPLDLVPREAIGSIMSRRDEATLLLTQPYIPMDDSQPAQPQQRGNTRTHQQPQQSRRGPAPAPAARPAPAVPNGRRGAAPLTGGRKY